MGCGRRDPGQIDRIRLAGVALVKERARADGVDSHRLRRDFDVLRTVAGSNIDQAARRHKLHRTSVEKILDKYDGYATEILRNSRR